MPATRSQFSKMNSNRNVTESDSNTLFNTIKGVITNNDEPEVVESLMTDLATIIKPLNDIVIHLMSGHKEQMQQQLLAQLKTVEVVYRKTQMEYKRYAIRQRSDCKVKIISSRVHSNVSTPLVRSALTAKQHAKSQTNSTTNIINKYLTETPNKGMQNTQIAISYESKDVHAYAMLDVPAN